MMNEREKEIRINRINEIRNNTLGEKGILLGREPSCHTTHHAGCDCQVQRHIKEKLDLFIFIDSLLAENKGLREAVEPIVNQFEAWTEIPDDNKYIGIMIGDLRKLKQAYEKGEILK
jgi:hypothetical protein